MWWRGAAGRRCVRRTASPWWAIPAHPIHTRTRVRSPGYRSGANARRRTRETSTNTGVYRCTPTIGESPAHTRAHTRWSRAGGTSLTVAGVATGGASDSGGAAGSGGGLGMSGERSGAARVKSILTNYSHLHAHRRRRAHPLTVAPPETDLAALVLQKKQSELAEVEVNSTPLIRITNPNPNPVPVAANFASP